MTTGTRPTADPQRTSPRRGDRGYVMALSGLIMIPLLLFAGFATDLGSWYQTASKAQRAADAAALAGVVWLPDEAAAEDAARESAARNGFVHGVDGAQVLVDRVGGEQLRVTVHAPVAQFFTQLVMDSFDVRRAATAEYVLPVPLGSPTNTLGTGDLGNNENFWLAISGRCASKEQGDLISTISDANYTTNANPPPNNGNNYAACTGGSTIPNDDYDERGYWYAVNLAADSPYDVAVQVYDGSRRRCNHPNGSWGTPGQGCQGNDVATYIGDSFDGETWNTGAGTWTGGRATNTTYTLHDRVIGFDYRDTPVLSTLVAGNNDVSFQGQWRTIGTLGRPERGIYPLQIFTGNADMGRASNQFALRAVPIGAPSSTCSTITSSANYLASCPQVHGIEYMGIMANLADAAVGGQASFYLAQVPDQHEGKLMEISLWDPGEGAQAIEVLDPSGAPARFDWEIECDGVQPPNGGCTGSNVTSLNVSGNNMMQPGPHRLSNWRYSDRMVRVYVELPDDFSTFGTERWWRIRYTVGPAPTDRTTWSVRILGDPVHLIPNS